ncbi:hypothetical protein GCM10007908_11840 [Rhizobium albus]|nr:hypothetical protein GCM10007908_11840 [Rhizobium albus]
MRIDDDGGIFFRKWRRGDRRGHLEGRAGTASQEDRREDEREESAQRNRREMKDGLQAKAPCIESELSNIPAVPGSST